MNNLHILQLEIHDIPIIAAAFMELGWNKPAAQYEQYLAEQVAGERVVLVAWFDRAFAGYLTICWHSHYQSFSAGGIPEIVDFNVLPHFRRQGIGSKLMDEAEQRVLLISSLVGIGVGLTVDYGAAQRLYVERGYIPDGCGLMSSGRPVGYAQSILVDDDLCLFFTKNLKNKTS